MAASQSRPRTMTASTCTPQTAQGTHVFKIAGYSLHRGVGVGNSIRSATFSVGGYDWYLRFYPDGLSSSDNYADYVAVFLHVTNKNTEVRASFDFRLVDQATGQSTVLGNQVTPKVFKATAMGMRRFMRRSELEVSTYMRDDCLVIECNVTVIIKEPCVEETTIAPKFEVQVPPDNLRKLLENKKGADVTFKVRDEVFPAHRVVLAMRSPVFSAELGPIGENTRQCIAVEDMHPDIFGALLHFIYTDTMPTMEEFDGHERKEMIKYLLVAADWYAMERLKLICEGILCKGLDVENVAITLALADQHHCDNLKKACFKFIALSNRIDNVVASQGYLHLKRAWPAVFEDTLENVTKRMHGCCLRCLTCPFSL